MPGMRGMSDYDFGLLEAHEAGFLGLDFQPEPDGVLDIGQGFFASRTLRVAARKVGTAHSPALIGLEERHPVVHGWNSPQKCHQVKFARAPTMTASSSFQAGSSEG